MYISTTVILIGKNATEVQLQMANRNSFCICHLQHNNLILYNGTVFYIIKYTELNWLLSLSLISFVSTVSQLQGVEKGSFNINCDGVI